MGVEPHPLDVDGDVAVLPAVPQRPHLLQDLRLHEFGLGAGGRGGLEGGGGEAVGGDHDVPRSVGVGVVGGGGWPGPQDMALGEGRGWPGGRGVLGYHQVLG